MTSKSVKIRSLILTALMVFSVFAGTVALSGSAAAAGNTSGSADVNKATHYVDSAGNAVLEVSFDENLDPVTGDDEDIYIQTDDGNNISIISDGSTTSNVSSVRQNGQYGRIVVSLGAAPDNVQNRVDNITVNDIEDAGDGETTSGTFDVRYAATTLNTADDPNANDESDDVAVSAYRGANVSLVNAQNANNESFDITGADNDVDRTRGTGINSETYAFDTDDLDLGDYYVVDSTGQNVTLEIEDLGLDVSADEDSFDDNENVTVTAEAEDIDRDVEVDLLDSNGDSVATETGTIDSDGEVEIDFGTQDADENYTAEVTDLDTGVTAESDGFDVVEVGDEEAGFNNSNLQEARGDVANITVELDNTDTATVQVGDSDDDNYYVSAVVEDDDDDGIAYVNFNSFNAGADSASNVLNSDTDSLSDYDQGGSFTDTNRDVGSDILESADYDVLAVSGDKDTEDVDNNGEITGEDSVATLTLGERSTDSAQVWTAPEDSYSDLSDTDGEGFASYVEAGNLTQSNTIAQGDTLVVEVTANGLEGALEYNSDDYATLSGTGDFFSLVIEEDSSAANADPASINVSELEGDNVSVEYVDTEGQGADTHYVVINSENLVDSGDANDPSYAFSDHEDGDSYTANFSVHDEDADGEDLQDEDGNAASDIVDSTEGVEDGFSVEDPEVDVDTNAEDFVVLEAGDGQEITGDTNFAPGTELTLRVRSDGAPVPFLYQPEPVIQSDGTFSGTVNFSSENEGGNFTVQPRVGSSDIGSTYDGYLVEFTGNATNETATGTDDVTVVSPTTGTETGTGTDDATETETGMDMTETDVDMTETEADGTDADEDVTTTASGPGFTAVIALIALVAAALIAVRRDN